MQGREENDLKTFEVINEVLSELPDFVNEWYINLRTAGKTALSCYDYLRKTRRFLEYISDNPKEMSLREITPDALQSFVISYQTKKEKNGLEVPINATYQKSMWYVLSSFIKFLARNKYIDYNFMEDMTMPKTQKKTEQPFVLTQNDFKKILEAAKENGEHKQQFLGNRDVLIILLFMTTGMTKSTLAEINLEDVDLKNQRLQVIKKGKTDIYDLSELVMEYMNKWLEDRKQLETSEPCDALFLQRNGKRLGDDSVYNIVKESCYKGIGKKLPPSKLRSGFCAILYKKTHDVEFVRQMAGLKSIEATLKHIPYNNKGRKASAKIMSEFLK